MKNPLIVCRSLSRCCGDSSKRVCTSFVAALFTVLMLAFTGFTEELPQREFKAYALDRDTHSADISPDEKLVVTQITRVDPSNDPSGTKVVELAQLWDFRHTNLVAEVQLSEVIVSKGRFAIDPSLPRFARFTADGQLVAIYLDYFIYVLSSSDLRPIRRIPINGPPGAIHSYESKKTGIHSFVSKSNLSIFELSPVGHKVAVVWTGGYDVSIQVELYDLDSGKQLSQWNTRDRGLGVLPPSALAWMPNGEQFVLAVPNENTCASPGREADLFAVDPMLGTIQMKMRSGLLVDDIAVTRDGRVWAVDGSCVGVFTNHKPKMRVFDIHTGKRLKELAGRGSGVRHAVAASRNGDLVAAYTGKIKVDFDWSDMVSYYVPRDETFSVWNATKYELIAISNNLARPRQERLRPVFQQTLRISSNGNFVLYGNTVYDIRNDSEKN